MNPRIYCLACPKSWSSHSSSPPVISRVPILHLRIGIHLRGYLRSAIHFLLDPSLPFLFSFLQATLLRRYIFFKHLPSAYVLFHSFKCTSPVSPSSTVHASRNSPSFICFNPFFYIPIHLLHILSLWKHKNPPLTLTPSVICDPVILLFFVNIQSFNMRSTTFVSALLAAGAVAVLANPMLHKRDIITDVVVVTVTDWVTDGVTDTDVAPTSTLSSVYSHHNHEKSYTWEATSSSSTLSTATTPTTTAASTQTSVFSSYVGPSSSTSTSVTADAETATSSIVPTLTTAASVSVSSSSATASSTSTSSEAASGSYSDLPTTVVPNLDPASTIYSGLVLLHHNKHRANHSASDLTWNQTLAGYAQTVAESCVYAHSM